MTGQEERALLRNYLETCARLLDGADRWSDAVRARNALAHEYPLRPDKRATQINDAWAANAILIDAWAGVRRFIEQECLLS